MKYIDSEDAAALLEQTYSLFNDFLNVWSLEGSQDRSMITASNTEVASVVLHLAVIVLGFVEDAVSPARNTTVIVFGRIWDHLIGWRKINLSLFILA